MGVSKSTVYNLTEKSHEIKFSLERAVELKIKMGDKIQNRYDLVVARNPKNKTIFLFNKN